MQDVALHAQVATGHDVVEHAHAFEQGQVLEGARHAHGRPTWWLSMWSEGLTAESDRSLLRRVHTVDAVEHRAFARTVGADDGAHSRVHAR